MQCDLSLSQYKKNEGSSAVLHQEFVEVGRQYNDFYSFYTNGSKAVSCAVRSLVGPSACVIQCIDA